MSHSHHDHAHSHTAEHEPLGALQTHQYRRVLWLALILNALMFGVEVWAGKHADSSALLADSADFLADAFNYGISLWALSQAALARAKVALAKGWFMVLYGIAIVVQAGWALWRGAAPEAYTMAWVSTLAFLVNLWVAYMFYSFRTGEANMRAVWLDARNDVLSNLAVFTAAVVVWLTATAYADILVALFIAGLACKTGWVIVKQAKREMAGQAH